MANPVAGLPEGFTMDYNVPSSPVDNLKKQQAQEQGGDMITVSKPMQQPQQANQGSKDLPEGFTMDYNTPSDNKVDNSIGKAKQNAGDPALVASPTYQTYLQDRWETFAGKIASDYDDSVRQATEAFQRGGKNQQTSAETALQVTGDAFNLFSDVIGTTVIEGASIVGDGLSAIVPDSVEEPIKQKIKEGLDFIATSDAGKAGLEALSEGVEAWKAWEKANPRAAENVKSVVDIGSVLYPAAKAKPRMTPQKTQDRIAELTVEAAKDATNKNNMKWMNTFDDLGSKTNNVRKRDGIIPDERLTVREKKAIKAVASTKGYSASRSPVGNLNVVNKELDVFNEKLDKIIAREGDIKINVSTIFDEFGAKADKATKDSIGDLGEATQKAYIDVLQATEDAIAKHGNSAKGLREARKELDQYLKTKSGDQAFNKKGPLVDAVNDAREIINDRISGVIPETKSAMDRISGLYHAQSKLSERNTRTSNKAVEAVRNLMHVTGLQRDLGWLAISIGIGGSYAAMASSMGVAAAAAGGLYLGGKGIKKGISKATAAKARATYLKSWSEATKKAGAGSDMAKQLRADRATMLQLIKDLEEIGPETYLDPSDQEFYDEQERRKREAMSTMPKDTQPLRVEVTEGM